MNGLLADADLIQFIAMVVVLALVAISTWVRKTVEKMQQREGKGQPIDVGKAVRQQLDKYMKAAGQLPPDQRAPTPTPTPAPAPAPRPPEQVIRDRPAERPTPTLVVPKRRVRAKFRSLANRTTQARTVHRLSKFSPRDVKRAVVQAEILGPPMALRKDYRLF